MLIIKKTLKISLSDQELINDYEFTNTQLKDFKNILNGTYSSTSTNIHKKPSRGKRVIARFYLSNFDLTVGVAGTLAVAAQAGPAALMAAWTGLSAALGGPFGAMVSASIGIIGIGFFYDLAFKLTGAVVQGKGVAFYVDWGFPQIKVEIE